MVLGLVELFGSDGRRCRPIRREHAAAPFVLNAADETGEPLPAGVYLLRATAGHTEVSTKLIVRR
jgi:hypothetical protein